MCSNKTIYHGLLEVISHNRENPSSRQQLALVLDINERELRRRIALARRDGVWIVSLLTGGYYVASDPEEWNEFCKQERRRAIATFKRAAEIPAADGSIVQLGMLDICTASAVEKTPNTGSRRSWQTYEREKADLRDRQNSGEGYECKIRQIADRLEV